MKSALALIFTALITGATSATASLPRQTHLSPTQTVAVAALSNRDFDVIAQYIRSSKKISTVSLSLFLNNLNSCFLVKRENDWALVLPKDSRDPNGDGDYELIDLKELERLAGGPTTAITSG